MNFQFKISVKSDDSADPEKIKKQLLRATKSLKSLECEVSPEIDNRSLRVQKNIESYADKLERLSSTLAIVARDFDTPMPYKETFARARSKKRLTSRDEKNLELAESFVDRMPQLSRIQRFLSVELPDSEEFARLRFLRELVEKNLPFPQIFDSPELLDAVALQAFENFHAEYSQKYCDLISRREKAISAWQKKSEQISHLIFVLESFDEIPALGDRVAPSFRAEFEQFQKIYKPLGISARELQKNLYASPTVAGVTFFSVDPDNEFVNFNERVERALEKKIASIREKSVLQILSSSKDPSVRKLTKLLALTNLEKILNLFTEKTAPKIIHEISRILGDSAEIVSFGDFQFSKKTIATEADVLLVVRDFEAFVRFKKQNSQKNKLFIS